MFLIFPPLGDLQTIYDDDNDDDDAGLIISPSIIITCAGLWQVPVDDVTLAARRQFADIKVCDNELRQLVSDSDHHYVYAVTSRRVCAIEIYLIIEICICKTSMGLCTVHTSQLLL